MIQLRLEALEGRLLLAPMAPLDTSFGSAGTVSGPFGAGSDQVQVTRTALQSDGKIVLAGTLKTAGTDIAVVRIDGAGRLDPTFGPGGVTRIAFRSDTPTALGGLAIDSQGRIVVGVQTQVSFPRFFSAARLTPSGQLDSTFGTAGTASTQANPNAAIGALAIAPGDQVVLGGGGASNSTSLTATAYLVRFTASGAVDTPFGTGGLATVTYAGSSRPVSGNPAHDLFVLPDGRMLLAGDALFGNQTPLVVTRLTSSGALDPTFAGGAGFTVLSSFSVQPESPSETAAAVQPDDSLIVGGELAGSAQAALERLTPSGVPDASFADQGVRRLPLPSQPGFAANESAVSNIALQADGKVVTLLRTVSIGGRASSIGGRGEYLLRFLPTGAVDPSFSSAEVEMITPGVATDLAVQPDGKYVVVGNGSPSPAADFQAGGPTYLVQRYQGATAPAAFRAITPISVGPSTGTWYVRRTGPDGTSSVTSFLFGLPGWKPVVGDFDGSGTKGIGVFDPSTATWYLKPAFSSSVISFSYGAPGWIPVVGDWDGDGVATVGVVDPSTMTWYLRNSNSAGAPDFTPFQYGAPGWVPVVGDWTGKYQTTVGVVDPATMTWYLRNSNSAGGPDITPFQYGAPGWVPVVGDWGLTFTTTAGAVDPSVARWLLRKSDNGGAPDAGSFLYGLTGWIPLAGPF
jgi:uncharacterized delta-60 repeat protein